MYISVTIRDPQEGLSATLNGDPETLPEALDLFKRILHVSGYSYVVEVAAEKNDGSICWSDDLDYLF